jgi:hypothetical protein
MPLRGEKRLAFGALKRVAFPTEFEAGGKKKIIFGK